MTYSVFRIIMFVCLYPVLPIVCFLLRAQGKPKGGLLIGVTLPYLRLSDPEVTAIAAGYRRKMLAVFFVFTALAAVFFAVPYFSIGLTYMFCLLLAVCVVPFCVFARANRALSELKESRGWAFEVRDDDAHWIRGIFYKNPDDPRSFVEDRTGTGMTANLAKPWAKVLMVFCAVIMAALLIAGALVIAEEFSPIRTECADGTVTVSHVLSKYEVAAADVASFEALDALPAARKISGTGLESIQKGRFYVDGFGECTMCADPRSDRFAVVETTGGRTYIFSYTEELERALSPAYGR